MSRYSQLYIERGEPTNDSKRFRRRLGAYLRSAFAIGYRNDMLATLAIKLGIAEPPSTAAGTRIESFFEAAELRDALDSITVIFDYVSTHVGQSEASAWLGHIAAALAEENLAYHVDRKGIVHPFVDPEFEANRSAAIAALAQSRFGEARDDFEAAFRHLRNGEGKQAIRMMFPAIEVAAKVLHPGAFARLGPAEIDRHIAPHLQRKYAGNAPAIDAGKQMLAAFKAWINASQPYRHGQEVAEPAEPPQEFVVVHLSTGAALLRWMVELAS